MPKLIVLIFVTDAPFLNRLPSQITHPNQLADNLSTFISHNKIKQHKYSVDLIKRFSKAKSPSSAMY